MAVYVCSSLSELNRGTPWGSARVKIPEQHLNEVLNLYIHFHRDGSFLRNYKHSPNGYSYLPLNPDKLAFVAKLLNETLDDQRSPGDCLALPFEQNPNFIFREHQSQPAAQLLYHCQEKNNGVLQAGCGNGKTVVMTWVAGKLGHKTLILVDMGSLQSQWQEAFQMVWGKELQIINKDTKVFSDVCVATFQLLHLNPALVMDLRERFGTILLDEFHSARSETRGEVLFKCIPLTYSGRPPPINSPCPSD